MAEEPGINPDSPRLQWRRVPPPSRPWRSRLGVALQVSAVALVYLLIVVAMVAGEPVRVALAFVLLGLPIVVVVLVKGPRMIRAMRSVDSVSIEPGPPAVLVVRNWSGRLSTHRLIEVSGLRPVRIGRRSADNPGGGDRILEIRIGTRTYRTRPVPFNWPDGEDGDVRLLENMLRRACPHAAVAALVNRTTWESDTAS